MNGKCGNFQTGSLAKPYTIWNALVRHLQTSRVHNPAKYADNGSDNDDDNGADNDDDNGADNDDADNDDDDDCQHPQKFWVTDHQTGDIICSKCGLVGGKLMIMQDERVGIGNFFT